MIAEGLRAFPSTSIEPSLEAKVQNQPEVKTGRYFVQENYKQQMLHCRNALPGVFFKALLRGVFLPKTSFRLRRFF